MHKHQCLTHGLIPHFYENVFERTFNKFFRVNALTGLSCYVDEAQAVAALQDVSMPSRAYTSFLPRNSEIRSLLRASVSMPSRAYTSFLPLIARFYEDCLNGGVNALSGLYLISTVPLQKPRFYAVSRACFCRYLSEYSDNSRFSCMLTFWTYLMMCT